MPISGLHVFCQAGLLTMTGKLLDETRNGLQTEENNLQLQTA